MRPPIAKGEDLSRRLRAARALSGLTMEELAATFDEAGLGYKTLGRIERGERELRRMEVAILAEALNVPPAWFWADLRAAVAAYDETDAGGECS